MRENTISWREHNQNSTQMKDKLTDEQIEEIRRVRTERAERRAERRLKWAEANERKASFLSEEAERMASVIPLGQPILVGHHSERRDRAFRSRIDRKYSAASEADRKANYHRQKAANILAFGARVKGDAERARQVKRELADKVIGVGVRVFSPIMGTGVVARINKKTYTIKFDTGGTYTQDKSWIRPLVSEAESGS